MNNAEAAGYALMALNKLLLEREMMPTERKKFLWEMDKMLSKMFDSYEEEVAEANGWRLLSNE